MAGYTRQSTAQIIAGQPVKGQPLADEFNAIQAAMHGTTGHTHDGTSGSGPLIILTSAVSGILPVANGGTGAANLNTIVQTTGTQNITGLKVFNVRVKISVDVATSNVQYLAFEPTDRTTGKPGLYFMKNATATKWDISLDDGTNSNGTINFNSSNLTWNSITLVDLSSTQTLTNKKLTDNSCVFVSSADPTKTVRFGLGSISTATQRIITIPDVNDTMVTLAATQTLTNKTITGGTVNPTTLQVGSQDVSMVKVGSLTPTGTVIFTSIPSSGYIKYVLIVEDAYTNAGAVSDALKVQVSTDNGSTFKQVLGDYRDSANNTSTVLAAISCSGNSSTLKKGHAQVELFGLGNSSHCTRGTIVSQHWVDTTTNVGGFTPAVGDQCVRPVAEADNALRLSAVSGSSITAGTFTLYGIRA